MRLQQRARSGTSTTATSTATSARSSTTCSSAEQFYDWSERRSRRSRNALLKRSRAGRGPEPLRPRSGGGELRLGAGRLKPRPRNRRAERCRWPEKSRGVLCRGGKAFQGEATVSQLPLGPAFAGPAGLRSMVSVAELLGRPSRPPDYEADGRALLALAQSMAEAPEGILQKFAETALALCCANSAGLSLLEDADRRPSSTGAPWPGHGPRTFTAEPHATWAPAARCRPEPADGVLAPGTRLPLLRVGHAAPRGGAARSLLRRGEAMGTIWSSPTTRAAASTEKTCAGSPTSAPSQRRPTRRSSRQRLAAPGGDRRVLRRRHRQQGPQRRHHQLECGGGADLRLHGRGGRRQVGSPSSFRPSGAARRRRSSAASAGRADRTLRDGARPQGRHARQVSLSISPMATPKAGSSGRRRSRGTSVSGGSTRRGSRFSPARRPGPRTSSRPCRRPCTSPGPRRRTG